MRLPDLNVSDFINITKSGENTDYLDAVVQNRSMDFPALDVPLTTPRASMIILGGSQKPTVLTRMVAGHAVLQDALAGGTLWLALALGMLLLAMCVCCLVSRRSDDSKPSAPTKKQERLTAEALASAEQNRGRGASRGSGGEGYLAGGRAPRSNMSLSSHASVVDYVGKAISERCRSMSHTPTMSRAPSQMSRVGFQHSARQYSKARGDAATHYAVEVNTLAEICGFARDQGTATFRVPEMHGSACMHATLRQMPNTASTLEVYGEGESQGHWIKVVVPVRRGDKTSTSPCASLSLQLRSQDDRVIGKLELQANGSWFIVAEGQPTLVIDGGESDLDLSIKTEAGSAVAIISCNDHMQGVEHVVISIYPGHQPVNVAACILAVLLFGEDDIR